MRPGGLKSLESHLESVGSARLAARCTAPQTAPLLDARNAFPDDMEIEPGMQFSGEGPNGEDHVVWIAAVEKDYVVMDQNHPLAGQTLHFDVKVETVRAATKEELAHGHAHGVHGHGHDHGDHAHGHHH